MLLILARDALSYARGAVPIDDCPAEKMKYLAAGLGRAWVSYSNLKRPANPGRLRAVFLARQLLARSGRM
jgi:hypothetical protein